MLIAVARVRFTREGQVWEGWFTGKRYSRPEANSEWAGRLMCRIEQEIERIWEGPIPSFNVDWQFPEEHHIVCKHLQVMFGNNFGNRYCDSWTTLGGEPLL